MPDEALLQVLISDPSGINVTGETGHEIELEIDNQVFQVTESFIVEGLGYGRGKIEFRLPSLEPGEHSIRLKAGDTYNNSGTLEVMVKVTETRAGALANVLFVPNPMAEEGHFTYILKSRATSVDIKIFTLTGRLVDEVSGTTDVGFNQVVWRPRQKLAAGTFLYQIRTELEDGNSLAKSAALQIINE